MKTILAFFGSVIFCLCACVEEIQAHTYQAASCSYADVSAAINDASPGDTVYVPTGNCTWTYPLKITKGVNMIGAGIGNTVITNSSSCGLGFDGQYWLQYNPSDYSLDAPFRLSGFTFNLNNTCRGLALGQTGKSAPFAAQTKVRVDHNRWLNPKSGSAQYIWHAGGIYGVIDSNIFESCYYPVKADTSADCSYWNQFTYTPGAEDDNMCFEDNTFNGISGCVTDCQWSGRYVYRYNDFKITAGQWSMFDMHGNGPSYGMCSCFGGEIYGNDITGSYDIRLLDHRGGQAMVFYNRASTSLGYQIQVREEYADSVNPPATAADGQPQHVSDSYYWNNRKGAGALNTVIEGEHVGDIPLANRDFFSHASAFNGQSGVGCGTVAQMQAITTCEEGVGFWATNQSCTDLSNVVGVNPITPISGALYRCNSSSKWELHYVPLAYPHPLRGETGLAAPAGLKVISPK